MRLKIYFVSSNCFHPLFLFLCLQTFQYYVSSRMTKAQRDALDSGDVPEDEQPDEDVYAEQLSGMYTGSRLESGHSLPPTASPTFPPSSSLCLPVVISLHTGAAVLARTSLSDSLEGFLALFESKAAEYRSRMLREQPSTDAESQIAHEEIHWLLLISANLIAETVSGESALIPDAILQFAAAVRPCLWNKTPQDGQQGHRRMAGFMGLSLSDCGSHSRSSCLAVFHCFFV